MARNIVKNKISTKPIPIIKKYTLDEYLSLFNKRRKMDIIIKKWYRKKEIMNVEKTKNEWDKIIQNFYKETEK